MVAPGPHDAKILRGSCPPSRAAVGLEPRRCRTRFACIVPHRYHVLGGASGVLRKSALGGEAPWRGGGAMDAGGIPLPARPDLSGGALVYSTDCGGGLATAPYSRVFGELAAVAQHHDGGSEPERLPVAPGGQGQAPKKRPETDAIFAHLAEKDGNPMTGVEGGDPAPEHRRQSHREDRGLLARRKNPRQHPGA